ncbi:MAG: polysaccharide deacetylase family protein [Ardenticatenaceae bacterium]|nr:polysaccharide deacetylase family protein [Ardenticatenaceae bacterium]
MTEVRLAVTFEAAGDPSPADSILQTLHESGVQATFFLDGQWARAHSELVRRIAAEGHELANHGFNHPDWTTLSDEAIRADLEMTESLVRELTGREVKPWARPPYGAVNDRVLAVLERAGYHAVYRNAVDGGHWPGETNADSIYQRSIQSAIPGGVIVFHTNRPETPRALPGILDDLSAAGFRLGTLTSLGHVPAPRLERHPDFAGLQVRTGSIRPRAAGRWQSLNLLEMGAAARRDTNQAEWVVRTDGTDLFLLTGDGVDPAPWADAADDRYVLVLAGELGCNFCDASGRDLGYLLAREGDLFLCPTGTSYQLGPTPEAGRRWVALIWQGLRESE